MHRMHLSFWRKKNQFHRTARKYVEGDKWASVFVVACRLKYSFVCIVSVCMRLQSMQMSANESRLNLQCSCIFCMDNIFYSREICRHCYFYDWHNCCFTLPLSFPILRAMPIQRWISSVCIRTLLSNFGRRRYMFDKIKLNWWNYCEYDWNSIDSTVQIYRIAKNDCKIYAMR